MNKVELKLNCIKMFDNRTSDFSHGLNFLAQYLLNLGIDKKDIMCFVDKPRESDQDNPELLDNIKEAADTLVRRLDCGAKVFVQVDSDTDGYTSAAVLINYIARRWPNARIVHRLHNGKEHGVILDTVPSDCSVVIIPDAGSNQFDEQNHLVDIGKTVIILDHHEVDEMQDTRAIIVNNQLSPNFPNKNLSGVGVVYMFIQYIDKHYFPSEVPIFRDYLDLTAVGIIADAMNMTALGNNYIAYYGLNNIKSKFLHELAVKQARGISDPDHLTKIDVAFYIAPVINGVIRYGAPEDKEMVFKALTTWQDDTDYESTWRGVVRHENLYQYAVRLAVNAKGRQDSAKKKSFEWLCEKVTEEGLDKDNVIIVTLNEKESAKVSPNITGLIAMELVNHYNKPALVLRKTTFEDEGQDIEVYGGSGRNGNFYGLPDLKSFLKEAGAFYCEGHANAFGAFLRPEEVQPIRDYANQKLNVNSFEEVYQVDYWFDGKHPVDYDLLEVFAKHKALWGNSIPQPKFAFSGHYKKNDIFVMGKEKNSLKINCGEISFVSFNARQTIDELTECPEGTYLIVGRPQLNEYMGNTSIQIMIDDIAINPPAPTPVKSLLDLI